MRRIVSIAFLLLALPLAEPRAFVIQTNRTTTGQTVQLHWPEGTARTGIPFFIDSRGSDDISDKETTFNVIRTSFKAWEAPSTTHVRFSDRGLLTSPAVRSTDRQNIVIFDEVGTQIGAPPSAGIIALTRVNSDSRTGEIFDADLIFNGRDFRFAIGAPGTIRSPFIDLQATATHEIGHILGLDHTGLSGAASRLPVMTPYDNPDPLGASRTLKPDDIAAVGSLYPSGAFSGMGRISGSVKKPDGTGAFGVQVVAYDESGAGVITGMSGYRTGRGGGGEYALIGLPPGRYTVGIEPLGGQVTNANFGGIFNQRFDTGFAPRFYENAQDRAQAKILQVAAGQDLSGADFSTGLFPPGYPVIQNPVLPANTPDDAGPYTVQAAVSDDRGLSRVSLFYRAGGGAYAPLTMRLSASSSGVYTADIPSQSRGTTVEYYVEAVDTDGHASEYPTDRSSPFRLKVLTLTGKPLAYVALRNSGAVSVLDTGADPSAMEVARVSVGLDPIGLTVTPDEKLVCVANRADNSVTLIETDTHRILATIPVGSEPLDLAPSPDGRLLYVGNSSGSTVSVIDLASKTQTGRISVRAAAATTPPGPYGIAVSPDGKRLYVSMINDNVVVALDPAGGAELARIPVVAQPRSLALSPDGKRLYVTGLADGAGVSIVNTATNQVEAALSTGAATRPFGVAVSPDGKTAYVTDYTNNLILIDTAAGRLRQTIPMPGQNTRGVAVSADGASVYVTGQDSNDLTILDAAAGRVLRTVPLSDGPRGIAFRNRPIQSGLDLNVTADFDRDGLVGLSDFFAFASAFGTSTGKPGYEARFDLSQDGQVGFADFFLFADQFGKKSR